ncbi:MAG TPA: SpoIIE family protein phosphatase [Vicinamibacterales bacterium]|nr:SpoIIE family protein phosphatase [Vicinamibacterales bacterium]
MPLTRTLPGRLVLVTGPLLLVLVAVQQFTPLPDLVELFRKVVAGALVVGLLGTLGGLVARGRRRFLWRVRRKLILSYVFLGFVPVVLVLAFSLAGSVVLYTNLAGFQFHDGFRDLVDDVRLVADTSAIDLAGTGDVSAAALDRRVAGLAGRFPSLSLAVLPLAPEAGAPTDVTPLAVAGAWRHQPPVGTVPPWLQVVRRFGGTLLVRANASEELMLVVRATSPSADGRRLVVADVPVDSDVIARIDDRKGTRIRELSTGAGGAGGPLMLTSLFRQTVAYMDYVDWDTNVSDRIEVGLDAPVGALFSRLTTIQAAGLGPLGNLIIILIILGVLFLVVQGSALVGGVLLARSITSAVHELFVGTEQVRSGDFTHRIRIESRDQLGDLAESFNKMSGSIEHLLHVQREKQRLDDELRIAREIQQSLLPVAPPIIEGLSIADLCEPAREVGGDYYDFFELGPRQLGVLIADVAGKGTSAALYMAELKGLMLALSHQERSPRQLLIEVNRLLAGHLDNRSFITMTYAVIDLDRGTLTSARAGHTPLLVVSGGRSDVITSDGMVLGLRLPGAHTRFQEVLAEHTCPIGPGDVIVLYTDGVTEAMDAGGELFGDAALARVVVAQQDRDAAGIRERVLRDVRAFVGDAAAHDDMTMIILKVTGAGAARRSA